MTVGNTKNTLHDPISGDQPPKYTTLGGFQKISNFYIARFGYYRIFFCPTRFGFFRGHKGIVSTQTTTGPVRSVMHRMTFVCCATNHSQESVISPHYSCPFVRANMAEEEEEEVTGLVAHSESDMCKAGFCW